MEQPSDPQGDRTYRAVERARPSVRRSWVAALAGVAARPQLWGTALRSTARLARPRWWQRPPFLPLPDRAYLAFRLETQYGATGAPKPRDLVIYLEWCREQRAIMRQAHR